MAVAKTSSPRKLRAVWDAKKKELGLTQASAAELLGFKAQATVNNYLSGRLALDYGTAIGFAKILQVPLSEIWEGDVVPITDAFDLTRTTQHLKQLPLEDRMKIARGILHLMLSAFNAGRASVAPSEGTDRFLLCSDCGDYTRHCHIEQGPPWDSLNGYVCQVCDEFVDELEADEKEFAQ